MIAKGIPFCFFFNPETYKQYHHFNTVSSILSIWPTSSLARQFPLFRKVLYGHETSQHLSVLKLLINFDLDIVAAK